MEITIDVAKSVFNWLNVKYVDYGDYFRLKTVCHGGNSDKLYFYKDSCILICYTNCGKMDLINFVSKVKSISNSEAFKLVVSNFDVNADDIEIEENPYDKFVKKDKYDYDLKHVDESVLNHFYNFGIELWKNEGIDYNTQRKFEIKFSVANQAIVIPHRYIDGSLVGIRQRNLDDYAISHGAKYVPTRVNNKQFNYPTGSNLYGFYYNKDEIIKTGKIILFEAEKSVMKFDSFYKNRNFSVALSGHNITNEQIDLINRLPINEIIIAFDKDFKDNDIDNIEAQKEILVKKYRKLASRFNVSIIWDDLNLLDYKNAPVDKGKETFEKLFSERKLLIND